MKKMKATLAIAMASVLTIGLVGCGSSAAPATTEQIRQLLLMQQQLQQAVLT